ncbi:DUF1778 domain-containing protein [Streptomyces sp. SCA2-4]|nr:DUF1778 domain-containing protein [Streptomyces huiliensis]
MSLRFPDPEQRRAIEAAAREAGVSMQEYILSAAYERATAIEAKFLQAFQDSMSRSGDAFAEEPAVCDPSPEWRSAEESARSSVERTEPGRAA